MRTMLIGLRHVAAAGVLVLGACGQAEPVAPASGDATGSASDAAGPTSVTAAPAWPASLRVIGNGYPKTGDPCRVIGESAATVDFLDDSSTLAGCPTDADAKALGGRILTTIEGITLVSVPNRAAGASAGDGDGQGDALVPGTAYNATADLRCAGYRRQPAGMCPAGVKRNAEGGMTLVEVRWPDGSSRTLFFDKAGKLVTADTSQADGSAAFQPKGVRDGDSTIVTIGPERYDVPDVFLTGD